MGGCATKPKFPKDDVDAAGSQLPEPQPQHYPNRETAQTKHEPDAYDLKVNEIVDDDQSNKRRSLSLLFKQNEDTKEVSTENEKTAVEDTVKQKLLESEKPSEDTKSNEPIVKQESPKIDVKLSEENKTNESAKQESSVVDINKTVMTETSQAEKPSEETHYHITVPATGTVKPLSEAEKPSVETHSHINEPAEETVKPVLEENNQSMEPPKEELVEAKERSSEVTQSIEPIKQEPIEQSEVGKPSGEHDSKAEKSETPIEERTNSEAVVSMPGEKVIKVVSEDAESVEKKTEEVTSSVAEKSHVGVPAHVRKASNAASDIYEKSEI